MSPALLEALTRLARARGLTDPAIILRVYEASKREKPRLYWVNPDRD